MNAEDALQTGARFAALYDVHGNLPALEAVLEEIDREGADRVVVGGDIVWGPFPREVIEMLDGLGDKVISIRGNADREVSLRLGEADGLDPTTAAITTWVTDQLDEQQSDWLGNLPATLAARVAGLGDVLFCHGSPRSDEEIITPLSPAGRLRTALAGVTQPTVVCGHTHMQFQRVVDATTIVNAGSVGMPYQNPGGAYWLLLGEEIELRRTEYDIQRAASRIRSSGCPHTEEVFVDTLLHPPQADDVARHFEAIEESRSY